MDESKWLNDMMTLTVSTFGAVVIITLGLFLSEIVARLVRSSAQKLSIKKDRFYAGFIRYVIVVFTLMLTLAQFQIPGHFILIAIGAVGLTLCVTFAIAFGFGGSAWAGKVLDKIY